MSIIKTNTFQDIFECRTCGLTDSLCCCTECARVCHRGHDCKLKRTSPTAYCDCWEKCRCRSLVGGSQTARFDALCRLAGETDLVNSPNGRGENILLFLAQTVGRQGIEQRQYRPSRSRKSARKGTPSAAAAAAAAEASSGAGEPDMPEHDLEPPRFARRALERLLGDWKAVRAMVMTGTERAAGSSIGEQDHQIGQVYEEQAFLVSIM